MYGGLYNLAVPMSPLTSTPKDNIPKSMTAKINLILNLYNNVNYSFDLIWLKPVVGGGLIYSEEPSMQELCSN